MFSKSLTGPGPLGNRQSRVVSVMHHRHGPGHTHPGFAFALCQFNSIVCFAFAFHGREGLDSVPDIIQIKWFTWIVLFRYGREHGHDRIAMHWHLHNICSVPNAMASPRSSPPPLLLPDRRRSVMVMLCSALPKGPGGIASPPLSLLPGDVPP